MAHGRVGDARDVVKHHRPGALEEDPVRLQARVVDDRLHPVARLEHLEHVPPALVAAVGGVHRVDGDVAARVGRQPVVGEDAVRPRVVLVGEDVHGDADVAQRLRDGVHLGQRPLRRGRHGLALGHVGLEGVVGRGRRVGHEPLGADQDDSGGGLCTHARNVSHRRPDPATGRLSGPRRRAPARGRRRCAPGPSRPRSRPSGAARTPRRPTGSPAGRRCAPARRPR